MVHVVHLYEQDCSFGEADHQELVKVIAIVHELIVWHYRLLVAM